MWLVELLLLLPPFFVGGAGLFAAFEIGFGRLDTNGAGAAAGAVPHFHMAANVCFFLVTVGAITGICYRGRSGRRRR